MNVELVKEAREGYQNKLKNKLYGLLLGCKTKETA